MYSFNRYKIADNNQRNTLKGITKWNDRKENDHIAIHGLITRKYSRDMIGSKPKKERKKQSPNQTKVDAISNHGLNPIKSVST